MENVPTTKSMEDIVIYNDILKQIEKEGDTTDGIEWKFREKSSWKFREILRHLYFKGTF